MATKLIERVKYIDYLEALNMPREHFLLTGSVWMAIMKIRENEDIDIIATKELRNTFAEYVGKSGIKNIRNYIDISKKHSSRIMKIARSQSVDDLVMRHYVKIGGYKFVKFRLFEKYKKPRKRPKDKFDRKGIKQFFKDEKHLLPEFKGLF